MKKLITIILTTPPFIIAGCGSSTPSYQLPVDNKNLASYLADDQIYAFYCPNLEKDICYQSVMYNDADAIKSVTTMGSAFNNYGLSASWLKKDLIKKTCTTIVSISDILQRQSHTDNPSGHNLKAFKYYCFPNGEVSIIGYYKDDCILLIQVSENDKYTTVKCDGIHREAASARNMEMFNKREK